MKAEGVVKVSTKGQIVIPKDVRTQFGIVPGKKLLVAVEENEILIKKMEELSLGELSKKLTKKARKERMDVDALVDEAIRWARKWSLTRMCGCQSYSARPCLKRSFR